MNFTISEQQGVRSIVLAPADLAVLEKKQATTSLLQNIGDQDPNEVLQAVIDTIPPKNNR